MLWLATKYLITAALVVLISELAKHSGKVGAGVAALPLVSLLTLIWLHFEKQPEATLAQHASYTFWYVLPTLPMFLLFPWLLARLGFWPTLGACALLTAACFFVLAWALEPFGIQLL